MTYQDEEDYDDDPWLDEDAGDICIECEQPAIDGCQCCGAPLCGRHSETGCGFCKTCPTPEWIEEQLEALR
jgi:hypothetical protein